MPTSPIQLSFDSEAERKLTHQLEERRQAKAARKVAQAAEATWKAKEERVAAEKVEEERKAAEKAEEERKRAEKVAGKQVAPPTTAKVDPKGLPLVEPVGLPDDLQQRMSRKKGTPKHKRKANDSKGGTPKKLKKTQEARGSVLRPCCPEDGGRIRGGEVGRRSTRKKEARDRYEVWADFGVQSQRSEVGVRTGGRVNQGVQI
ncbi:hypothetical protein BC628DRAFT_1341681 [Trametes gibbosa]|nr:hypothetical protein BC628DRAFT_1341678 [Trametes gibbosa]KAI0820376.1 hypothetical protein BC628DRAFT_1341681 [Trametes gibbosa]